MDVVERVFLGRLLRKMSIINAQNAHRCTTSSSRITNLEPDESCIIFNNNDG